MSDNDSGFFGGALANRVLKRMPGGSYVQEQLERIEHRVLSELKQRLDKVERGATVSVLAFSVEAEPGRARKSGPHQPGELLRGLLEIAAEQTRDEAEQAWYVSVLKSLVPDEARILSALSDGSEYPMIHILAGARLGATHPVLQNLSNIGRLAGVQLLEQTPTYIRRLRDWGLVETGPEDAEAKVKYEILESDGEVRRLLERIHKKGQRDQILRRTLKLSELGRSLWAACRISED